MRKKETLTKKSAKFKHCLHRIEKYLHALLRGFPTNHVDNYLLYLTGQTKFHKAACAANRAYVNLICQSNNCATFKSSCRSVLYNFFEGTVHSQCRQTALVTSVACLECMHETRMVFFGRYCINLFRELFFAQSSLNSSD